ncbi:MAG: ribonuclease III [Oscillospiraceae bacterium]|nr:ribonuclease III [Oscillospiraceae bacterium]
MIELEQKLQYTFKDRSLLENALRHSSYANEGRNRGVTSNERLEFLGDSVLGFVTAKYLYKHYPELPEGKMTKVRAELVCEHALHAVAQELGLGNYIRLGKGEENTGGRTRPSILADAVEATIAAMFLDGGMEVAEQFILTRVLTNLEQGLPVSSSDNKTRLQELIQQKNGQVLTYAVTGETGPDHCKQFTVSVSLNGDVVGSGTGRTKKEAEQAAAGDALGKLK